MDEIKRLLARVLPKLPDGIDLSAPPARMACGALPWMVEREVGESYCDAGWHTKELGNDFPKDLGRCPTWRAQQVKARLAAELVRLAPVFERLEREGGSGWHGIDLRDPVLALAHEAMRRFAMGRPPRRGVYLRGPTGTCKSRMMLAAYVDLLGAGVNVWYVTPRDLRRAFEDEKSRREEIRLAAMAFVDNVRLADVVLLDEVGMAGDQRFVGEFREGLWHLLENTRAVFAVATNLDGAELERNPDVGPQNFSRLVRGAEVFVLGGKDRRIETATVVEARR